MFKYILDRLKEPSTWRGVIMLVSAAGINVSPELATGIIATGLGAVGLVDTLTKDKATN